MPSIAVFEPKHIDMAISLWRTTEHIGLSSADEPAALAVFLDRNPGFSFVGLELDVVVGAALCGHDGRRGYLHHLAVVEGHRRGGLGRRLLESCLDRLRVAGIGKCHAFVFYRNPFGDRFWRPLGWQRRNDILVYSRQVPGSA